MRRYVHVRLYAVCVYISRIIAWEKGNQNMYVTWLCVVKILCIHADTDF